MNNRCEHGRFLMARNHIWRYTLRLFHTFAIFEQKKDEKWTQKGNPKVMFFHQNVCLLASLFGLIFHFFLFEDCESVK